MTDEQFMAWLKNPAAVRMVLIEAEVNVAGAEVTRYIASREYVTGPADAPANTVYLPLAKGGLAFTEQVSLTGEASLSSGDIELDNGDGALDSWLGDVWRNRRIRAWSGDPAWPRAEFRLVFDGIVDDVGSSSRDTVNLVLRDKLQRLNTPISEAKLGGTSPNKDAVLPIPFGACSNVTPLLKNPGTLEYGFGCQVEGIMGGIEYGSEARYNGKPVAIDTNFAAGSFKLLLNPNGNTITCSVLGDNGSGYAPRIAPLVRRIATAYGKPGDRFTDADLDLTNLAAFDAAHTQPVGLYVADRINQALAIQQLAASVGAQAVMSATGQLRLIQIALPARGVPVEIGPDQMLANSLRPAERLPVVAAVKIAFDRNYTVQTGLAAGLLPWHADLYATEWLTETVVDEAVQARYRLTDDPVQIETCLKTRADARGEAQRRLALRSVPRTIYELDGEPELAVLQLGAPVVLRDDRWGLAAGAPGVVVMMQRNWLTGRVTVGVMV